MTQEVSTDDCIVDISYHGGPMEFAAEALDANANGDGTKYAQRGAVDALKRRDGVVLKTDIARKELWRYESHGSAGVEKEGDTD